MKPEEIKDLIAYIKTDKIKKVKADIAFYKKVKAKKDLTDLVIELDQLKKSVKDLEGLLKNGPQKKDGLKVKVTAYKDNLVIETLDPAEFDEDFISAGHGRIGCSLKNNKRLGISKEAVDIIGQYKRVRDVIGDLMGDVDDFTWIGPPMQVLQIDSVVSRDFKMPMVYQTIANETPSEVIEFIDKKKEGSVSIEYKDFKQEIWIELTKKGSWKKGSDKHFILENAEGARFVRGSVYDKDVRILNAPEGMITTDSSGNRKVEMDPALKKEILDLVVAIFKSGNERFSWEIQVKANDIMRYINRFFELGFDNNIMNPRGDYWRMSIVATPKEIRNKLRKFWLDEVLPKDQLI